MTVCLSHFGVSAMFAPKSSLHFDVADSTQLPPSSTFVSSVMGILNRIEAPLSARDQKLMPLYPVTSYTTLGPLGAPASVAAGALRSVPTPAPHVVQPMPAKCMAKRLAHRPPVISAAAAE